MNTFIEALNLWSVNLPAFAWQMFWQSSLLIAVVFAFDFVLRRKVRAAVRYSLWLVVILKLMIPPTLSVPTGIAWWLRSPQQSPLVVQARHFVLSYPDVAQTELLPEPFVPSADVALKPAAILSWNGWTLLVSTIVSAGLLTWAIFRWRYVVRITRNASPANDSLRHLLDEMRRSISVRRSVQLRLTNQPMSPAVCGLIRPVILLPVALGQLTPNQMRAVLLHELIHLKRGDVWINCLQTLVQIVYWWHPLVWFANARIRHVREEAVDDAVMLTLRDEGDCYAPTLLEVAKLAFHRPLASLGLVGILESRSALRQRIERLIDFKTPRRAGLTFVSSLGIVAFTAMAVPMGEAPKQPAAEKKTPTPVLSYPSILTDPQFKTVLASLDERNAVHNAVERNSSALPVANVNQPAVAKQIATPSNTNALSSRRFKVDPNTFIRAIESETGTYFSNMSQATNTLVVPRVSVNGNRFGTRTVETNLISNVQASFIAFFRLHGVDLSPPKSIFFGDRENMLWVRATDQDLNIIEQEVQRLQVVPPQINIRVQFVEVLKAIADEFWESHPHTNSFIQMAGKAALSQTALTPSQTTDFIKSLQNKAGVKELNDEQVTMLSNRQAQLQTINRKPVVVGLTNGLPVTEGMSFGPTIEVVPSVQEDGYTIQMKLTPSVTEFLGYDGSGVSSHLRVAGKDGAPSEIVSVSGGSGNLEPRFRLREMTINTAILDGQTVVLGHFQPQDWFGKNRETLITYTQEDPRRNLLVFITPIIIDRAGNRVHTEEEVNNLARPKP